VKLFQNNSVSHVTMVLVLGYLHEIKYTLTNGHFRSHCCKATAPTIS